MRVGVCEWLAWLLRMRREPEAVVDTMTSSRRRSFVRRQSTRDEDVSNYSLAHGGTGHLANFDVLAAERS